MKYYIPTTSMNFNCILSSESVSPAGFYSARGFGYSRWFTVPENDQEGAILLYSNPFSLKRPASELEDHPMFIEIDTDEKFRELADGVFACDHTIYLNSLADKIILLDEKDKDTVLSLSDSSLETKMVRFYKKRILVRSFDGVVPDISKVERIPLNQAAVEQDQHINKIKGLLYGYYIGALLSAEPKDVVKLNTFREIQNIFSAVASSERRSPTETQSKRLSELFSVLRRDDPFFGELIDVVGSEDKAHSVVALARKYGHVLTSFDEERLVKELAIVAPENPSQRWAKSNIDSMNSTMQGKRQRLSVESDEIVAESVTLLRVSDKVLSKKYDNRLFLSWINEVLSLPRFNGKISTIKEALSDDLTVKAKEVLGEEWKDGNAVKLFMNDLRRHVRGASFDHRWDNGILSSMAAVVTKGDDWEKLLFFMQSKGMTDYRLAFAFFGMLNGFANLTRDFTDILLNQDANYLIDVYREFYGQLHGVTIRVSKTDATFDKMLQFFNGLKIVTRKGVSKESLCNALKLAMDELSADSDPNKLLDLIVKKYAHPYGWKKTIKPWKELKKYVTEHAVGLERFPALPGFEVSATKSKKTEGRMMMSLRDDHRWIDDCAQMIEIGASRNLFNQDVKWFLNNKEFGKESEAQGFDKSNAALILRLERYLSCCANPTKESIMWKKDSYKRIPVDEIVAYLRRMYA